MKNTIPVNTSSMPPEKKNSLIGTHEFDLCFKIVVLGDSGVGKTCFIKKYVENAFSSTNEATLALDFKFKTIQYQNKKIKLHIWDTAGQEKFRSIISSYFRGVVGFILMYDVTDKNSFENIQSWLTQINNNCWSYAQVVIVGAKCDLTNKRVIKEEQAVKLSNEISLPVVECSSKTGHNVDAAMMFLVKHIFVKIGNVIKCETDLLRSVLGLPIDEIKVESEENKKKNIFNKWCRCS